MSYTIIPYDHTHETTWDQFCDGAVNAVFLHTRRFLNYHRDRYQDCSLLIFNKEELVGLLPAAYFVTEQKTVVSHPGITFGGIVHQGVLRGQKMLEAFDAILAYYRRIGAAKFQYKAEPFIYPIVPAQDDLYALFRLGAKRYRTDLSCAIDMHGRLSVSDRRKRGLKKALKSGVVISEDLSRASELWTVLENNLLEKYKTKPVHTFEEINRLQKLFPFAIRFAMADVAGKIEAGVVLFISKNVHHCQYITSSGVGNDLCALDLVFEHCIAQAKLLPVRYFDFGTSNGMQGFVLNESLYKFKSEFGAGGVVYEFYEVDL